MEQSLDNLNEMLFNGILIVLPFVDRRTSSADQHLFFGSLKHLSLDESSNGTPIKLENKTKIQMLSLQTSTSSRKKQHSRGYPVRHLYKTLTQSCS